MQDKQLNHCLRKYDGFVVTNITSFDLAKSNQVSLSDILMQDVPQRFYLSRRAARGILRRCEKRGGTLPSVLMHALTELGKLTIRRSSHASRAQLSEESLKPDRSAENGCTMVRPTPSTQPSNTPSPSTKTSGANSACRVSRGVSVAEGESQDRDTKPLLLRRLTPIECERLQGFPEGWTVDGIDNSATRSRSKLPSGSDGG